ncbi:aspartic peptidase domain-containing protein [Mycena galopus ATCC 62051]|nr:aspartic peptidase domain-containing protein [Mycena galopus ATCC 62051]
MVQLALDLLATAVLLALHVTAGPVQVEHNIVTLPISRRCNFAGAHTILETDMARLRGLKSRQAAKKGARDVASVPVSNGIFYYTAAVGVGNPPTEYKLIVDSGSANTWVGAGRRYVQTSTSESTGQAVASIYGSGSFSGTEFTDQVTLAPGLVISQQSIGVASNASGFDEGLDGILGIGPTDLTEGTLKNAAAETIPTVVDNLVDQGTINSNEIGIFFEPTISRTGSGADGFMTFGGIDETKFTGSVSYTPVTTTFPASRYWGVDQTITYGSTTILASTSGIIDTGATLILLASDGEYLDFFLPFDRYQAATGAVMDSITGLLRITPVQYVTLKNLNFVIGGVTYALIPNAQIWPRALNRDINGTANFIYLIIGNSGEPSGKGLDFTNGMTFLERFYSVFDPSNERIGLATCVTCLLFFFLREFPTHLLGPRSPMLRPIE